MLNVSASGEDVDMSMDFQDCQYVHKRIRRVSTLLLDYQQFLAARRIQRYWRMHNFHRNWQKYRRSVITIQRWWRGFSVRMNFMKIIEEKVQAKLLEHYDRAAVKIQSMFRGWYERQTVHDAYSLRRMQLGAAEELLSCVAYKLHHLLRTHSIPGIYSLRNSKCLSKVEKLLTSITFRFHNDRVRFYHSQMGNQNKSRRNQFRISKFMTPLPFAGPNFRVACRHPCEDSIFGTKYMDVRIYKVIENYENSQRDPKIQNVHRTLAERKRRKQIEQIISRNSRNQRDFCGDVIESMRKWKIWDAHNMIVSEDIFRRPEVLNSFLEEVSQVLNELNSTTCHCEIKAFDKLLCP